MGTASCHTTHNPIVHIEFPKRSHQPTASQFNLCGGFGQSIVDFQLRNQDSRVLRPTDHQSPQKVGIISILSPFGGVSSLSTYNPVAPSNHPLLYSTVVRKDRSRGRNDGEYFNFISILFIYHLYQQPPSQSAIIQLSKSFFFIRLGVIEGRTVESPSSVLLCCPFHSSLWDIKSSDHWIGYLSVRNR